MFNAEPINPAVSGLVFTTNINATNATISVALVMPVELATFSGKVNGQLVNLDWAGNVSLSPVPAQDQLQVNLETALRNDGAWQLLDYAGRLLQSGTTATEAYSFTIDVAKLSQGAYILRLIDGQTVVTKQFQK